MSAHTAQRIERLAPRQREVFEDIVVGLSNKEISHKLNISPRTVKVHRAAVMRKMQAQNLTHLVRMVLGTGKRAEQGESMRAPALLDRGEPTGSAQWGRNRKMTNVLLSKTTYAATVDPTSRDSIQPMESVNLTPTLSDLPSPDIKRWRFQYKALVVTAVRTGLINVSEACARYSITIEEFLSWKRLLDEHGLCGLRTTRLQEYRRPASGASGS